jgi:hypothetical protein
VGGCHLYVVPLGTDFNPLANPVALTPKTFFGIESVTWTRDGQSVVFDGLSAGVSQLMRVRADANRGPEPIEIAGLGAHTPTTARNRDVLGFARVDRNIDIYSFGFEQPARAVVTSSFWDFAPSPSADGARLAFNTDRSGDAVEIWVADADGSRAKRLLPGPNKFQGSPQWSPDGKYIAFDSRADDGHWHLWTVDSEGGTPRQITHDPGSQNIPFWSRDGQWVYFTGDSTTGRNAFRVSAGGGTPEQLTRTGGSHPVESPDGHSLLYQSREGHSPLLLMPLGGGAVKQLVSCVFNYAFAVGRRDVFYIPCSSSSSPALHVLDPSTGEDRLVGTLEHRFPEPTLGVSLDGNQLFYSRFVTNRADLMLIEGFK